jgi:hypothetical protein
MVPAQAIVMMFGFSLESIQVTITAGTGDSIVPGFQALLPIFADNSLLSI